jgi:hypothetical protein
MKIRKNATPLRMPKGRETPAIAVESRILFLRHQRVILDTDLASLRSNGQAAEPTSRAQSGAIPFRLQLSTQLERTRIFEVAICNLKENARRPPLYALCVHRTLAGRAFRSCLRWVWHSTTFCFDHQCSLFPIVATEEHESKSSHVG